MAEPKSVYRANFLWPHDHGSIEEAGYEFANAKTEDYMHEWWSVLLSRLDAEQERGEL